MREPRQPQVIQSEYANVCSRAGDINYQIKKLNLELDRVHVELSRLDEEFAEATRIPKEDTTLEYDQRPEDTKTP